MKTSDKIRKSLRYSILDMTFYSMMLGFGETFFSAFAVFLKASLFEIGLIGSIPPALGSMTQLISNKLLKIFNSRKKMILFFISLHAFMYIPIALVYFCGTFRVIHLIIFACVYFIVGMMAGPAWSSWMGELVPKKERGSYFGRRNKIGGFATFFTMLIAGYILQHHSNGADNQYLGFVLIFGLAFISRIISIIYLSKQYEPKFVFTKKADFSFIDFVKQAQFTNYGLLVLYLGFINYAVYMSAPFFTVFMLEDLKLSYWNFTIITAAALIVKYLSMPIWGKACDKYGTRKVLSLGGYLMPLVPILWVFNHNVWYLILIQIYSGFVWGAFDMAASNFIFDATSPEKRATCVAYYNVLNGIFIFVGAMAGTLLVRYNHVFWSKYLFIFLLSGLLRYIISFVFVPKLKEVRPVEHIPYTDLLFHVASTMTTHGFKYNFFTFNRRDKK